MLLLTWLTCPPLPLIIRSISLLLLNLNSPILQLGITTCIIPYLFKFISVSSLKAVLIKIPGFLLPGVQRLWNLLYQRKCVVFHLYLSCFVKNDVSSLKLLLGLCVCASETSLKALCGGALQSRHVLLANEVLMMSIKWLGIEVGGGCVELVLRESVEFFIGLGVVFKFLGVVTVFSLLFHP